MTAAARATEGSDSHENSSYYAYSKRSDEASRDQLTSRIVRRPWLLGR